MVIRIEHALDEMNVPEGAKKLFIKSYGCQMNVYDAMRMGDLMKPHGYHLVEDAQGADLVVLNTCHIREKADDKVFSDLGRIKAKVNDGAIIAVGGCMGQAMGADIIKRNRVVEVVFGPQSLHRLPEFVQKAEQARKFKGFKGVVDTEMPELEKFDHLPKPGVHGPTAFVSIQEGCDKFCTYCVVPYTRGQEISRPVSHVEREVIELVEQGVREVTLLGQNVNAYFEKDEDGNDVNFSELIRRLARIDDLWRIRFTTSHPNNMSDELIQLYGEEEKLMPYLHLPVQAGSNKILTAMNRNHTAEGYLEIIRKLRDVRPDMSISGDFIVGFPGESEEDYMDTLSLVAEVEYQSAYSFKYSPRPGTPASTMDHQVPEEVKAERLAGLQALLDDQQEEFNHKFIGKTLEILVDEIDRYGQSRGRTPHNIAVTVNGDEGLLGKLIHVNITGARPKSLMGEIVQG